jgi:hypothetical protein
MSRLLSAIILGGSLVIGAFLMSPPRYEGFPVEVSEDLQRNVGARAYAVFDRRTGEVCYRYFARSSESLYGIAELLRPEGATALCPVPSD